MKKILYFAFLMVAVFVSSCSKDEIGGTATQSLAGEWYVQANIVNADGTVAQDPYGIGRFHLNTYNTAENVPTKMWINDLANFWKFAIVVDCNTGNLTFSSTAAENQSGDDITVNVTNGKVLPGAGKQNNGAKADSITMDVEFSDDPGTIYRLEGVRYSGLVDND